MLLLKHAGAILLASILFAGEVLNLIQLLTVVTVVLHDGFVHVSHLF